MTLFFEEEGELKLPIACEQTARDVITATLDFVGCPYEAEINLLLTMNEEIRKMNAQFRNIDCPTDVLSFPMIDYNYPADFSHLEDSDEYFDPESGELCLGDIVISKEKVLSQAQEYGHTVLREYAFLIVHSVLHLTGYDHMEADERFVMEGLQDQIMDKINILR